MRNELMKVFAVGKKETLLGLMLAGIKERLETDKADDALSYLHELAEKETACMVIITSDMFSKIKKEIDELQDRKRSFIFWEFSGGDLRWREKT
jgi:vacuolar-type H+-ATPase subunit F/Vma7